MDDGITTFSYKDYKSNGCKKQLTLSHAEFIRRFAQHILPHRFVWIRHYGMLSSTWKRHKFKALRNKLKMPEIKTAAKPHLRRCPCCKTGTLITIEVFGKRGPPKKYIAAVPKENAC